MWQNIFLERRTVAIKQLKAEQMSSKMMEFLNLTTRNALISLILLVRIDIVLIASLTELKKNVAKVFLV